MDSVLLMTATIDPGPTPVLTLKDPTVRLQHYVAALLLWSRRGPFDRIVICENSGNGHALGEAVRIAAARPASIEVLTFEGNSGSWQFGKGYGEGLILEHALSKSTLLKHADSIWKTTGRLFVQNAAKLVMLHEDDPIVMRQGDTRFFKFDPYLFRQILQPVHRTVNDHKGVSIEVAYDRALEPYVRPGGAARFRETPEYIGQDAGSGNWHVGFPPEVLAEADEILAAQSS